MKQLLKDFKKLIEESNEFPKDELRDYYLVPAKEILKKASALLMSDSLNNSR